MRLEFLLLAEKIRKLSKNKPILYCPNPGNWGDALIRVGTLAFLNHFHINYQEVSLQDHTALRNALFLKAKLAGQLIVFGGGGAWCQHYPQLANTVAHIQQRYNFNHVLVLPSSYDKKYSIKGVTFCRRDNFNSKEYMEDAFFCHDMAFFLEPIRAPLPVKGETNVFRTDVESSGNIGHTVDNYDLSAQGNERDDVGKFFEYLSQFEVINTDRLHVSIAASMLNRKVNLYAGSYFKNQAIYNSSIKDSYPLTAFINSSLE